MRRRTGSLVPLEVAILDALAELRRQGLAEAHGYLIASTLRDAGEARRLTAYGTLYKALERLEEYGAVDSRWEDPAAAAEEARPRRRYYRITLVGDAARAGAQPLIQPGKSVRRGAAAT